MIPPLKHVVENTNTGANVSTVQTFDICEGVINPNPYTTATNVRNGSLVKNISIEVDFFDYSIATIYFDFYVWFNINGTQTVVNPAGGVNISHTKNQVFHQGGSMIANAQATAVGVYAGNPIKFRFNLAIPKSWQQVNEGDKIQFVFVSSQNSNTSSIKFRAIYKEIFP